MRGEGLKVRVYEFGFGVDPARRPATGEQAGSVHSSLVSLTCLAHLIHTGCGDRTDSAHEE